MAQSEDATGDDASPALVKSVGSMIDIIEVLQELRSGTVTDIANVADLSVGAVYKHLMTLEKHDFVVKEDSTYRLGFRFLELGGCIQYDFEGSAIIESRIKELANETNSTVTFLTRKNEFVYTIFVAKGEGSVQRVGRLGNRFYVHQTSAGKAILSQLPDEEVDRVVENLDFQSGPETAISSKRVLLEELEAVREQGYALNFEESTPGLNAVAAPVVPSEEPLGAVVVGGPCKKMSEEELTGDLLDALQSAVSELELSVLYSRGNPPE